MKTLLEILDLDGEPDIITQIIDEQIITTKNKTMNCVCPNCSISFDPLKPIKIREESLWQLAIFIRTRCTEHFGVTLPEVLSHSRKMDHVKARHLSMYFIQKYCLYPLKKIAGMYGARHHSTVIHAVQRVEAAIFTEADLYSDLIQLLPMMEEAAKDIKRPALRVA